MAATNAARAYDGEALARTSPTRPAPRLCYVAPAAPHSRYHRTDEQHNGMGQPQHMRSRDDIAEAVQRHADTVLRACTVYLRERADREDAFQETFLRYARHEGDFNGEEHKKAWLIRVASNVCKDMLKSAASKVEQLDELAEERLAASADDGQEGQRALEHGEVFAALRSLDERYRTALYLKYYEGYTAAQIAQATGMPENTVYTNLARGRRLLKGVLDHG